jgi:signal transduction histidine kinase
MNALSSSSRTAPTALDRIFPGDSELAGRMRAFDWKATEVGEPEYWPINLRVALQICLASRFPMNVWWGPKLTLFYNDAYISFLGSQKHPAVLGRSGREAWSEIWPTIGPMIETVMATGVASWSEDILMFFEREVPKEEVYVTFSFSPIYGEGPHVEGLFCACTETTAKLIGNRRSEMIRQLAVRASEHQTSEAACRKAAEILGEDPNDVPFAAIYVADRTGTQATLCATTRVIEEHGLPPGVSRGENGSPWSFGSVLRNERAEEIDLSTMSRELKAGPWPEPIRRALVLPIPGTSHVAGLLVIGASPRRPFDDSYRSFFELIAVHIGTAVAEAEAYEAERLRAAKLAELDRAKTLFFSNVSHEFRTPLTLMLGPLEDARQALTADRGADVDEHLDTVHRNALRLHRLVNALLDFAQSEEGRAQASFEPIDLAACTADLALLFRAAIERAGLQFVVRCDPLPDKVYVDREMWEKVVLNLLSNAFKFTFEGSIEVSLSAGADGVELRVKDTGIGISADELPRVFERFHRIEGVRGRTQEGSGIGLALVHDLIKMHGGSMRAESTLGAGTTFIVSLRFGSEHLPQDRIGAARTEDSTATRASIFVDEALRWLPTSTAAPLPSPSSNPSVRVLVADDNADMRDYLARILGQKWAVELAADSREALGMLRTSRFDLLVTDVMMPAVDGFALLREVRSDPCLRDLPVIVLSARAGDEARIDGLEIGADDYVVKPFSARELAARVDTLLTSRRQAAESARVKDEFIAMLGHELRNPLSPIVTAVQLLRMRGEQSRELAVIERQSNHLVRLVDDLLDISRITRGKIELRKQRLELANIVVRGVEMASPLLEQRWQRLEVDVSADELTVEGDPERLAQVVSNLLTNASKYSEPHTTIRIDAGRKGPAIELRVKDEGIGIPRGMLDRVFDMFVQQPQASDRSKGGLGLGLAIVRSLVTLHGGHVWATSPGVGKGSEFVIELPAADPGLRPAAEARPAEQLPIASRATEEGRRILVVDDNEDAVDTLAMVLSQLGYRVATARDGPSAIETARRFHPEVCLLDIGLPVMDGYELAERLRTLESSSRGMRLIAVTGYGTDADRRRSEAAGFCAHMVKPVSFDELMRIVAN